MGIFSISLDDMSSSFAENQSHEYRFLYESSIIDPAFSLEWNPENRGKFPAKLEPFFLGKNGENIILPLTYEPMTVLVVLDAFDKKVTTPSEITQTSTAYVSMDIFQGDDWAGKTIESRECDPIGCIFDLPDEWRGRIGELLIPSRAIEGLREENGTVTIVWGEKNAKIPLVLGVVTPK